MKQVHPFSILAKTHKPGKSVTTFSYLNTPAHSPQNQLPNCIEVFCKKYCTSLCIHGSH